MSSSSKEPVPGDDNRLKPSRWAPLWNILGRQDKVRQVVNLDDDGAVPREENGETFEMASENQNSAFADATRGQGYSHCHSFHTIVPSLWGKQRKQEWTNQKNGDTIFANLGNMVRGGRMPGELVDRLNGPCAKGHKCQYFSPASGYYFDESKKGWQPFRNTGYSSRDENKANRICDTLNDDLESSKANHEIMSEQMHCMHTKSCLGGVYNEARDRCMCLTTQDKTHINVDDYHTNKDGETHIDHKDGLPPMQNTINHILIGGIILSLLLLAVTYFSYRRHWSRVDELKQQTLPTKTYSQSIL